jgi:NAD(P)-dependent dehydrogenase (short-subunit alcohol dehydrogenase family)
VKEIVQTLDPYAARGQRLELAHMSILAGKVAVITGGTSGIGMATAELFAREGARVVVTGRSGVDLAAEAIGNGALGVAGDVADLEHHKAVAELVKSRFGALDIYMANAGVIRPSPSDTVSVEDYDRHFAINTRGVFFGVQAIMPIMREGGSIIVTSSLAATKPLDAHTVYAGSKAAVAAFARNWALELRPRKIRVNVLSPGPVDTPILGKLGVAESERPNFVKSIAAMIPAGRLGEPRELAHAALFLASSASSFVNGVELHVDGGMSLR